MRRVLRWGVFPAVASLLVGCGDDATGLEGVEEEVIEEVTFAASLDVDLSRMTRLPSGVYIEDLTEGTGGALGLGGSASATFRGWLSTGVQFTQGTTTFLTGNNEVIAGFEQGMLGMKVGGVRRMIIPPALAFGTHGDPSGVPGGAVVIYEAEMTALNPLG